MNNIAPEDILRYYLIDSTDFLHKLGECVESTHCINHLGGVKHLGVAVNSFVGPKLKRLGFSSDNKCNYTSVSYGNSVDTSGHVIQREFIELTETEYNDILRKELSIRELEK